MKVEDSGALRFLLDEEIYLLPADKPLFMGPAGVADDAAAPVPAFTFLGGNTKKLLILVSYPEEPFMEAAHLAALERVLGRLSLSLDDAAIVNMARTAGKELGELQVFFEPHAMVIFGGEACPAGIFPGANSIEKLQGIPTLMTFSFAEMMSDTTKKKLFWEQMKSL